MSLALDYRIDHQVCQVVGNHVLGSDLQNTGTFEMGHRQNGTEIEITSGLKGPAKAFLIQATPVGIIVGWPGPKPLILEELVAGSVKACHGPGRSAS